MGAPMRERPAMREGSAHLPLVFSSLGHCYVHLFMAFYFVIVLALEEAWALPYHELIELSGWRAAFIANSSEI